MSRPRAPSVPPPPIDLGNGPGKGIRARGTLSPMSKADLSITCPTCATLMQPEHAHYKCPRCGYRDSCCF
jgi:hypothetical protein